MATKIEISLKRRNSLRNTFAYLSPPERRRGAGSSSPGVGVNRYDQPRPRYEKSTFVISRLVELARFAVTGPSAARSPRLWILSRGGSNAAIPENTLELGDHLGVRLPVFVLPRWRLASSIAGRPVHATLSPTGLVEKLHGPPPSRVRVQQQFWILQHRSAGVTSHFHGLDSLATLPFPFFQESF